MRSIVDLGHNVSMEVLAEGAETPRQRDFLARPGCDSAQGCLYSQPVRGEACPGLLGRPGC